MSEKKEVSVSFMENIIPEVIVRYFKDAKDFKYKFKEATLKGNVITKTSSISKKKIKQILTNNKELKNLFKELSKIVLSKTIKPEWSQATGGLKNKLNKERIDTLINALNNPTDATRVIINQILDIFDTFVETSELKPERKVGSGRPKKQPPPPLPTMPRPSRAEVEQTIVGQSLTQDTSTGMSEIKSAVSELRKPSVKKPSTSSSLKQQQQQQQQQMRQKLVERQQMEENIQGDSKMVEVEVPTTRQYKIMMQRERNTPLAPIISGAVPVSPISEGGETINVIGQNFRANVGEPQTQNAINVLNDLINTGMLGERTSVYISRLLSGEYSIGDLFNLPSINQRQLVNVVAGLAILSKSKGLIPKNVNDIAKKIGLLIGAGVVANRGRAIFGNALNDFDEEGKIKAKEVRKLFKKPVDKGKKPVDEGKKPVDEGKETQIDSIKKILEDEELKETQIDEIDEKDYINYNNLSDEEFEEKLINMEEGNVARNFINDPEPFLNRLINLRSTDIKLNPLVGKLVGGLVRLGVGTAVTNRISNLLTRTGMPTPPPSGTIAPVQTSPRPPNEPTTLAPPSTTLAPPSSTIAPPIPTTTPSLFTPRKIETFQQDTREEQKSNQIAKPNYIVPSVSVLDPENQKEDFDIQAGFDFDIPFAMNGVVLEDNPLMQQHRMEEMIRYSGGGIWVGNEDWNDPTKVAFEKPANEDILPRMVFNEDYEDMPYNPNVTMETNIAYNDFTNIRPTDPQANSLRQSTLLGRQP